MGSIVRNIKKGPAVNAQWIYDTPVHSDVEGKMRQLLVELGNDDKILGIQVCTIIQLFFSEHGILYSLNSF